MAYCKNMKQIHLFGLGVAVLLIVIALYNRNVIQGFASGSSGGSSGGSSSGSNSSDNTFTMYYVDWCPHCKSVKPVFNEFMGNGTVLVNGKSVKCKMVNAEANPDAMKGLNVKGYPSFLLNSQGKLIEFNGERNADGFMSFLNQNVA